MPWRSLWGKGMKNDAIPSTTMISPTTNSAFIELSLNPAFFSPGGCLAFPEFASEFDQTAHRNSRWPLCDPTLVFFHPGGACDVEMDPRRCFREFAQERSRGTCSSP